MAGVIQRVHSSGELWLLIDEALADIDVYCPTARVAAAELESASLVEIRHRVRERLLELRAQLAEMVTERDVYFILFPLVIHVDELIRTISHGAAARWEPLQSELYDIENGGELFYSTLDDCLRQAETAPVVFEVFYYCLSAGFQGMYQGEPRKIEEYKARLAERIPRPPVRRPEEAEPVTVALIRFPFLYYAVAAGVVLAVYLVLTVVGVRM